MSEELREAAEGWLKSYGGTNDLTPLTSAFRLACRTLDKAALAARIDEEAMTGALLGAIAATFSWTSFVFPLPDVGQCSWRRYRKSGNQKDSENVTGADFALVIRLPAGKVRIALFQAKRARNKKAPYIELHHISKCSSRAGTVDTQQFLNLRKHALKTATGKDEVDGQSVRDLTWVHYVAYSEPGIFSVPMSAMEDVEKEMTREVAANEQRTAPEPITTVKFGLNGPWKKNLHEVLTVGCQPEHLRVSGWLTMDEGAATAFMARLVKFTDVIEADENNSAPSPLLSEKHFVLVGRADGVPAKEKRRQTNAMLAEEAAEIDAHVREAGTSASPQEKLAQARAKQELDRKNAEDHLISNTRTGGPRKTKDGQR